MSSTAVKRACDACHRRKVKCDGINPCRNCSSAQLSCTYLAIPQKKGPKGSRAKVISELRENQRQTSLSAKVQNQLNGVASPPTAPTLAPTPGLLTPDVVKECRDFFFNHMYPIMPILHRERLEQQTLYMDTSIDTYCLVTSLCAFMMLQPGMSIPGLMPGNNDPYNAMPGANLVPATLLLEETLRCRKGYDYLDSPSHNAMCTSYFLFAYYYTLQSHDKAWYHLREATTLAHMMGMNKEEKYVEWDTAEGSRRKRLFWLLFVTERAYALQRGRPLTLQATLSAPTITDDPNDPQANQLHNFVTLVNLFRPFDDTFVNLWNKTMNDCSNSLASLQKQFGEVVPVLANNNSQFADLHTNQQWLKDFTWRIGMANGRSDPNMNFQYSLDVPREALSMASSFSNQGMSLLGVGLIEKLLDVTSSLTEYLNMQPASRVSFEIGPREHLGQLLNMVALLRNEQHHFTPLLLSKLHNILPGLVNPMLPNAPESATAACNIDLFDDVFGQSSAMQQQVCFEEYESKFPVEFKTEPGNTLTSGPPPTDRSSSYVSSPPGVVSPGMEFNQGLSTTDFSPMSNMVMSPMGQTPDGMNNQQQQHQSQHQHQQHRPMTTLQSMTPGISIPIQHSMAHSLSPAPNMTLSGQSMDQSQSMHGVFSPGGAMNNGMNSMGQNMNGKNIMMRQQPPQRANTFAMSQQQQFRTVGDFQALQRTNTDINPLGSMGMEYDFNTLR